jgi:hypothetical protein
VTKPGVDHDHADDAASDDADAASDDADAALARFALAATPESLAALDAVAMLMDIFAVDAQPSPARCLMLQRGLAAVLPAELATALVAGARTPADIAARFFRLRRLLVLQDVVNEPRVTSRTEPDAS